MKRLLEWGLCVGAGLAIGCGGSVTADPDGAGGSTSGSTTQSSTTTGTSSTATTGTTTTATSSSSSGAGGGSTGDCQGDADCPGSTCVELTPGGFKVCVQPVVEATACSQPGLDECCTSADCAAGTCLEAPLTPYCAGPPPQIYNVCATDECATDADCGPGGMGGVCVPAGTLGRKVRSCMTGSCKVNSDCGAEAGGSCAPVADPCCYAPVGLFCVYPGGCRSNSDCPGGHCEIGLNGSATCQPGDVPCPG